MPDDTFLHVHPHRGWLNDPNGMGLWGGRWHVMYQWNPDATTHGNIHWGHASSSDLVHWRDEGAALAPRAGTVDAGGAWSGVAVVDDGVPTLVYTAVRDGAHDSGVVIAPGRSGPHGDTFTQATTSVAPHPQGWIDVRDPFLLTVEGRRYAVQGAGRPTGGGAVLVYAVPEVSASWELLGELAAAADLPGGVPTRGDVWECPQLVRLGETWVLIVSWLEDEGARQGVTAYTGDLEVTDGVPRFVAGGGAPLDHGPDFYAPQALVADDRVLVSGWSWESRADGVDGISLDEIAARGWAGLLTIPRELVLEDGVARLVPCREVVALSGAALDVTRHGDGDVLTTPSPTWLAHASGPVELHLVSADASRTVWSGDVGTAATVLVDGTIVEIFAADGSHTLRVYPRDGEAWVLHARHPGAGLEARALAPAWSTRP
ncbi:glycoside hydrolase family 32 protein [Serinibacter arcticus]|uniref:glycoside hydrolase family 32 protein n=1 Tax=Serinibacter arcticus TaxID=1655435 RepID=UPI0013054212|nr:glycoside hydrolase family 32 protein [Serinibacter arcticus]